MYDSSVVNQPALTLKTAHLVESDLAKLCMVIEVSRPGKKSRLENDPF